MFMGLGMPIPDLSNKPGPGRPGWGPTGSYDFQFEVSGAVSIKANAAASGNFRISWPNGTTNTYSGNNASISAPDGTAGIVSINNEELDTTYMDEFAVVSGQANVSKVVSWGNNAWSNVFEAFKDCTNLTDISTTSFLASGQGPSNNQGCYMTKMFDGCTSLLEVDIRNWNLQAGVSWKTGSPFYGLSNLEKLDATGLKIKFQDNNSYARNWFYNVGSATTNGCEFKLSGLDYSSTTNTGMVIDYIFGNVKFKDGSNLSNWKFPSHANSTYIYWFSQARISGTLDMSGWTTFNGSSLESMFYRFNQQLTAADGSKFNMSNWNFPYATSFYRMFWECEISEVIGFNTWGATNGSPIDFRNMFHAATLMRINPSDNFSNAFSSSLNVGNVRNMCQTLSSGLANADVGVAPSFAGADFSNMTNSFRYMFQQAKIINSPDFSTCTFSASNPINFGNIFYATTITDTNNHFILNNQNLAISYLSQSFWQTSIRRVTIGNNVDLSNLVSIDYMSYQAGFDTDGLTLPSNADYSSLTTIGQYAFVNNALSTCQVDTFIRQNWATNLNTGLTCDLENNKITAAPSIARSNAASLTSVRSWNITLGSPDAALPFAYASYAVDPTGITTISPTVTPPAGSVFTATNGLSISASGVITIGTFRGGSTIRCTYPDGCYNEVVMLIQVPFKMNITIPAGSTNFELKPQMSAGECFIDWGDGNSQTLTANTTHSYASSGSNQTYSVKIFDSPNGSKFTGFNGTWNATSGGYIDDIAQWGEIEWQNNSWFVNTSKSTITATDTPNLSQVTSLQQMFSSNGINSVFSGGSAISNWDVSTITNMSSMFWKVGSANFTQNLSNWDVSNVTTLQRFNYTYPEYLNYNQNWVADWGDKTSKVEDFSYFMYGGKNNSIATNSNMGNYNTSSATNMSYMFFNNGGDIANCKTKIVNAGQADEYIAWDVKKVENFSYMFAGGGGRFVSTEFPDNWYISGNNQDINMQNMFGWFYGSGSLNNITDVNSFATKTISAGTSPYGTQYTAWDMSNTTNLVGFAQQNNSNQLNWNINTWQISNKLTRFDSAFGVRSTNINWTYTLDQDLGHWDISNVTNATNSWFNNYSSYNPTPTGFSVNFSTANYESMLVGWGAHASSAQSGVTLNMGTSKYTAGGAAETGRTALINAGWTIIDGGGIYSNTNALSFNGSTEYVDTFYAPDSSLTNAFSISAYVKASSIATASNAGNTIIGTYDFTNTSGSGGQNRAGFYVNIQNNSGAYELLVRFGSYQAALEISNFTLSQWNHIAITYDGTDLKLYCNGGSPQHTVSLSSIGLLPPLGNYDAHLYIGATNRFNSTQSTGQHWHGDIDEVMLWNTALTQGEVQAYDNVIGSGSIPDPNAITGLQLWNRMGD